MAKPSLQAAERLRQHSFRDVRHGPVKLAEAPRRRCQGGKREHRPFVAHAVQHVAHWAGKRIKPFPLALAEAGGEAGVACRGGYLAVARSRKPAFFYRAPLAAEVSRQSGRDVACTDLPQAHHEAALLDAGLPAGLAALVADSDARAAGGALFDAGHQLSTLIGGPTPMAASVEQALVVR